MDKVIERQESVSRPDVNGRTLLVGWLLVIAGAIPLSIFCAVLVFAMLTTDFASGANFNLDIFSGLMVLVGTPSLICILIGAGKIRLFQNSKPK